MYNMREEPVLFVNIADDFVPYTIKTRHNLDECVITGKLVKEADLYESNIRKQVSYKTQGSQSSLLVLKASEDRVLLETYK